MSDVKQSFGKQLAKAAGISVSASAAKSAATGLLTPVMAFPQANAAADGEMVLINEDGTHVETNSMLIDLDHDGKIDVVAVDENGDGIGDAVFQRVEVTPEEEAEAEEVAAVEQEPEIELEPVVEDDYMDVATTVDDSMSFSQAFAAARREVGAGGLFTWRGNTYGTYYKEEWDAMTADDKEQYWADVHHTTSHLNEINDEPLLAEDTSDLDDMDAEAYEDESVWDATDAHEDIDMLASNDIDPDIPIDNNMDMSAFA